MHRRKLAEVDELIARLQTVRTELAGQLDPAAEPRCALTCEELL